MDERLSANQAAAHLGIAASTVRAYRARGQFPPADGEQWGRPYWTRATLDAWQAQRPGPGNWRSSREPGD